MKTLDKELKMVDLHGQYLKIKTEIDAAIQRTIDNTRFIGGAPVNDFANQLAEYLGTAYVIPCGNGTDALQLALMALDLKPGDEVIVPAFTYVATAEVIALLGLQPVMVDVDEHNFNIDVHSLKKAITSKTKVIVPVHLFGQSANMQEVMEIANKHNLFVIEDNAQSIGATCSTEGGSKKTGTIGTIGTYSFFPSKNLGCYGDGGAVSTDDEVLAKRLKMIASHGQSKKYYHEIVGVNSRLDSMQAAILSVKLKHLNNYIESRAKVAMRYDELLNELDEIMVPSRSSYSTHVFHQYTLRIKNGQRDALKEHLSKQGVPSMIYYPLPLYKQNAYRNYVEANFALPNTETLCSEVLSLPMHTEMDDDDIEYICSKIKAYYL